ncbi:MAG: efflux RND transporter permease subunit [Pseudomonadota bacterium]
MRRIAGTGGVLSYFARHGTAANLLLVILVALGLAAFPKMRAQFFPDVVVENITVSVAWDGAGAEDVDAAIVQLVEPAVLAVDGVEETSSRSREGSATIDLEFEPGWNMDRALDNVQQAVDALSDFPDDAEDPVVRRAYWRDRVTDVVVSGPVGTDQLARFTDEFVARLFENGVTRTTIRGLAAPETVVEVPSVALIRNDISMAEIADAIAAEVQTAPAGNVTGANARVRAGTERRSASEIEAIVLRSNPDGSKLLVGDLARVRVEGVDRTRSYFVGENPAISVRVDRSAQGDAIDIQRTVEAVAEEVALGLPEGVEIDLIRTRSEAIVSRLNILMDNGLLGLALVVGLLFLFLNARTALWVAAGIPVAMLTAIALMYAAGLTINMISLFALIITLGIVVDDAIVVGEHADFRARNLGESPVEAAENAAIRMSAPVFSATVTTIIAFFGLTTISGRFGDLIADVPFTVIVVLLASLIECFLILPRHMAHALVHTAKEHWYDWPSRQVNRAFLWVRDGIFRYLIRFVVVFRYPVLAVAILLLATQVASLLRGDVPWRFFDAPERGSISGNFAMLPGASRDDTLIMMRELQRAVDAVGERYEDEYGRNPVDYVLAEVGGTTGRGLSGADTKDQDQLGSIAIELIDRDLRTYSSWQVLGALEDEVVQHPMVETLSFRGWRSGPGGDALDVKFYGADAATLKAAAEDLKQRLTVYPEVSAVEDNLAYDKEELVLDLTAQGQALGFTIDELGRALRNRLGGIEAASYPDGTRSATVRVELPAGELTADFLDRTLMRTANGDYVPLADLVTVTQRTGFSTVRRENGVRVVTVSGDISEDNPMRATEISEQLRDEILPDIASVHQVDWRLGGLAEDESRFLNDAALGFGLCLLGIYLTLAWIFASWTRPIVVMAVIPFGLIGAVYGHAVWDVPLSMFSIVGLIGMTGIIINDSIVLVTTVDDYARDRGLVPAIIDGAADRLRPVLLTTLTTVLGLTPLLYEPSQQALFLKPTVITLVYGLGFGMFLVLLVVPALLAMQMDVGKQLDAMRRALFAVRTSGPVGIAAWVLMLSAAGLLVLAFAPVLTGGALLPQLLAVIPALGSMAPLTAALAFYIVAVATVSVLVFAVFGLAWALTTRRSL